MVGLHHSGPVFVHDSPLPRFSLISDHNRLLFFVLPDNGRAKNVARRAVPFSRAIYHKCFIIDAKFAKVTGAK